MREINELRDEIAGHEVHTNHFYGKLRNHIEQLLIKYHEKHPEEFEVDREAIITFRLNHFHKGATILQSEHDLVNFLTKKLAENSQKTLNFYIMIEICKDGSVRSQMTLNEFIAKYLKEEK